MKFAKISETGGVIIPPEMCQKYGLRVGSEITLTDTGKGIMIQPKQLFPATTLNEVAGCLKYQGSPKTIEDMEAAIGKGIQEQWDDCS